MCVCVCVFTGEIRTACVDPISLIRVCFLLPPSGEIHVALFSRKYGTTMITGFFLAAADLINDGLWDDAVGFDFTGLHTHTHTHAHAHTHTLELRVDLPPLPACRFGT